MSHYYLSTNKVWSKEDCAQLDQQISETIIQCKNSKANTLVYKYMLGRSSIQIVNNETTLKEIRLEEEQCKDISKAIMYRLSNRNAGTISGGDDSVHMGQLDTRILDKSYVAAYWCYQPLFSIALGNSMIGFMMTIRFFKDEKEIIDTGIYTSIKVCR